MDGLKPIPTDPRFQDLAGQRFGRLTVIGYVGKDRSRKSRWLCRCDCGGETVAGFNNLKAGRHNSRGRHRDEVKSNLKHGGAKTPEYRVWKGMRARCQNERNKKYKDYGGRGIRVCEGFDRSFAFFLEVMGPRPTGGARYTVERADNDRGYDCGRCDDCKARGAALNCRWATDFEQAQNRRNVRRITHGGETHTLAEWGRIKGLSRGAMQHRIDVRKAGLVAALETPKQPRSSKRVFR